MSEEMKRRLVSLEMALFGKTGNSWHSTGELPSGVKTGTRGAMTHITDQDGFPVSKGFHSITEEIPQMTFVGKTGATVTRFRLDMCDFIFREPAKPPEPELIQGYTAEQWQEIIDGGYLCEFACEGGFCIDLLDSLEPIISGEVDFKFRSKRLRLLTLDCRPAQLKGVLRPIFAEPEKEAMRTGTFVFFDKHGNSVRDGQAVWNYSIGSPIITKYIEV